VIKVGDLVEIPEIKTVIQLRDIEESSLRQMILDSFVVTTEVMKNLEMILTSLSKREGRGAFLKGHFGSGKSHFLSILSLLLHATDSWQALLSQEPSLEPYRRELQSRKFFVVEISLIQHRGTEFLEDIFLKEIFRKLSPQIGKSFEEVESRHEIFQEVKKALSRLGYSGLVLLVDELSEFLRSKTDAHAYQEDIRFIQYLGEEASSFPLWIVASLQEWIEETGEIHQDTFNKIKDRYRLRISLGRAHIEELVSQRLIRHRPDAEQEIRKIYQSLRRYFPSFPVDETRFLKLYPVHPATVTLLDRLRPLFSEHRGVVDFIHYRLKGDAERGISTFLDRPAQDLLCPPAIFDHFVNRIREMAETQPFVEKGFDYYRDEIPRILEDPDQQKVALEAVKLLILFAISPMRFRYTARHMAEMILFRVTDLEAEINYHYFRDVLDRLVKETSHLSVTPGKDPLEDQFTMTLRADIAGILRRKIRQGITEIFPGDRRLFDRLLPFAESIHLPFVGWAEQRVQRVSISWEYTRRGGVILLRQIDEFLIDEATARAEEWKQTEEDFFIVVGTTHQVERQYQHLRDLLLPHLREKYPGLFLFWVPAEIKEEEESWMKEFLSALLLSDRQRQGSSESELQAQEFLQTFLQNGRKRLGEILTKAYFNGLLLWDDRQTELSAYGYLSQERFLKEFVPPLLSRRFPKHQKVHPYLEALAPTTIPNLLKDFFATGTLEVDDRTKFGLRTILEGLLKPMGLIKKKGNQYVLHVDPRNNELTGHFLSLLEKGPLSPEKLYWSFRKGDYGLLRHQFEVLIFALSFSGNILLFQGQRKKGLEDISRTGLQGITAISKGEILADEVRQTIPHHPLIPDKFRKAPFTLSSQEALWAEIRSRKEDEVASLQNFLHRLKWVSSFQAFKNLPWDSLRQEVEDVLAQWEEVKVTFPPREGLERFLSAAAREPFLPEKLHRLDELRAFFDHAERLLFIYQYLSDPRFSLPERPPYRALRDEKDELLRFFEAGKVSIDQRVIQKLLERFQDFREKYIQVYAEAHRLARSGEQFTPYKKIRHSRRYLLLARLDQLEMISVHHNRSFVDRALTSVLLSECTASPVELLQSNPVCSCGFPLAMESTFTPVREIEEAIDSGILETIEALNAPTYQEKLLPYLKGLEEIGENEKASAVRSVLSLSPEAEEGFLSKLDAALTPLAIQGINEAFKGRIVVVNRDLDRLYGALIRRKYSLPHVRRIFREWLKEDEISEGTFVHFIGKGETGGQVSDHEGFLSFIQTEFPHLLPFLQEEGQAGFKKALLLSLWIEAHEIPSSQIAPAFPFLHKGNQERGDLLLQQLPAAARLLLQKEPNLFERAVQEVEEAGGVFPEVSKLLEGQRAINIFRRETIFPSVLRDTFERLLAAPEDEREGETITPCEDSKLPPRTPGFIAKQTDMIKTLNDYEAFWQKLLALRRRQSHPPQDFPKWESLYVQYLSPLSSLLATFPARVERMEINLPLPAKDRLQQARALRQHFSEKFSEFYRNALPLWEKGEEKRPKMIEDLEKLKIPEGTQKISVLMDGMRWDLWEYLKENFFASMGDQFRIAQEGALWARLPSTTPRQMEFFTGEEGIWKITGIDERVHTEKGNLEYLFRNILQYLQLDLAPRLRKLPATTQILLFSDHGFTENPNFEKSDKYRMSRYSHGEASPFEIIVPWAVVTKIR
jgi:energy-coupling factor transporter ATP-binding protein EcfA2